jgi:uncharacterized membrane protein
LAKRKIKITHEGGSDSALERIKLFSDAVIAIALTLLALEIRLPAEHHIPDGRLIEILLSLWQRYLAFFVSFGVIAFLWIAHWRKFQLIERANSRLVWLNFLFLFAICCVPFAAGLPTAVAVYAAVVTFASLSSAVLTFYARKAGLMKAGVTDAEVSRSLMNSLFIAGVFAISIGIAFFDPVVAKYFWLILIGSIVFSLRAPVR